MGLTRPRAHQLQDIDYKQAVRVISTTNVNLTGGAPNEVDGVSLSLGDRILVAGQSTGSQNGIYQVTTVGAGSSGTWARASTADETGEINAGMVVMVTEGTANADTQWKLTTDNPITVGTTALTFEQASAYAFGTISANGTSIVADSVGDTVTFTPGDNIAITGNAASDTITIGVTGIALDSINSGTSNVSVVSSGGNVTVGIGGSEVAEFSSGGLSITGNILPSANVTYNLGSDTARWNELFLAGNTINLGTLQLKDNSGKFTVFQGDGTTPAQITGNIAAANVVGTVSSATTAATVTTAAQPNITSVGTLSSLSVTGNIDGGNLNTGAQVVATGNITGGNINTAGTGTFGTMTDGTVSFTAGNISGVDELRIDQNGTGLRMTNVGAFDNDGSDNFRIFATNDLKISANGQNGTAITIDATNQDVTVANDLRVAAGNIFYGGTAITATATELNLLDGVTGTLVTEEGTQTLTNKSISGSQINSGTIPDARIQSSGVTQHQGDITGTGALNSGSITSGFGSIDTGTSTITTTGNISGGNLSGTLITGTLTTAAQPNITSVGALSSLSVTGNVTGGNLNTGAQVVATGNVNGGNIVSDADVTTVSVTASGNVDAGNVNATSGITAGTTVVATGNITGGNLTTAGDVTTATLTASGAIAGSTTITGTGNVTGGNLITGGQLVATGNVTGGNLITAGSLDAASLSLSADAVVAGNLTVGGDLAYVNVTTLAVEDPIIGAGRGPNNAALSSDDNKDRGIQLWYYTDQEKSAFLGYDDSEGKIVAATDVSISSEVVTVSSYGGFVVGDLESNSLSSDTTVTATGNITGGNLNTGAQVVATGNITGGNINSSGSVTGNGRPLTSLNASNLDTGTVPSGRLSGSYSISVTSATTAGTVTTAAQPNITSVGALSSLSVTGNVTGGNLVTAGQVVATGNVTGGNILGNGAGLSGINFFSTVNVSGQTDVVASGVNDSIIFATGDGIAITTDAGNSTVTFATVSSGDTFTDGADFGLVTESVTEEDDLGSVEESPTATQDLGLITTGGVVTPSQFVLPSYTVATLPSASPAGQMIYVSDETSGGVPAFSDGTNWRRVTDRNIVS